MDVLHLAHGKSADLEPHVGLAAAIEGREVDALTARAASRIASITREVEKLGRTLIAFLEGERRAAMRWPYATLLQSATREGTFATGFRARTMGAAVARGAGPGASPGAGGRTMTGVALVVRDRGAEVARGLDL